MAAPGRGPARRSASVDTGQSAPPATLTGHALRPYQLQGFRWLAFLWQHQLGGILADDMGLGKTVQSLALISHARQADPASPPFLIVAPTSVVSNWAAEAAKFAPDLKVVLISDTMAKRRKDLAELIAGADAVVTTYTLLRLDFASYAAAAVVRADPGRGPVHQEPAVEGLSVRPETGGPVQAGHHRHADGEQPDGAVVAAVDHGARAVPASGPVPGLLRPADREAGQRGAARPAPAPDQAASEAPDQGTGCGRPARQAGAGARGRAAPAAPQALRHPPPAGAAEGPRA